MVRPCLAQDCGRFVLFVELQLASPVGDEALRAEAHQQDEREPEGEELVVVEELELVGNQEEQRRTDERTGDGAHAAEHDRGEQEGRVGRRGAGEQVLLGRDGVGDVRLDGAGQSGQRGADGERDELDAEAVDAHGERGGLVLADGDPGAADAGVAAAPEDEDDDGRDDEHQQEVVGEPAEGEAAHVVRDTEVEAEDLEVGDGRDAVGAVGDVRPRGAVQVVGGDPEDLTEAEGHDGEVVAAQPQRGRADQDAEHQGGGRADQDRGPEGQVQVEGRAGGSGDHGGGVGADPEEGHVAEVEQAGEADDDVQAERHGGEDQDVDAEGGVLVVRLREGEAGRRDEAAADGDVLVPCGDLGDVDDQPGPVEGGEAETGDDQEADEQLVVLGADAVGEDQQGHGEGRDDDEDLDVGGRTQGRRLFGGEGRPDGLPVLRAGVLELVPAGVVGVERVGLGALEGQREGAQERDEGDGRGDVAAGFEVDDAAELGADRDDRVPGGGEGGEGGELERGVGAGGCEPAESLDAVRREAEQGGEGAGDQHQDLEAAGVAVDGEVAGELGGPGPGEEGGDDGEDAAAGGEGTAEAGGYADEAGGVARCGGAGLLRRGGLCGHRCHALSATRSPSRPCGLNNSTRMRRMKAQTSAQDWLPNLSRPGTSAM